MAEYPRIANAFKLRKDTLRGLVDKPRAEPRGERLRAALDQAERYRAKAERLERGEPKPARQRIKGERT
jgi:hypothetical protein